MIRYSARGPVAGLWSSCRPQTPPLASTAGAVGAGVVELLAIEVPFLVTGDLLSACLLPRPRGGADELCGVSQRMAPKTSACNSSGHRKRFDAPPRRRLGYRSSKRFDDRRSGCAAGEQ